MDSTCYLARPSVAFKKSYLEALREGFNFTRPAMAEEEILKIEHDFGSHLQSLDKDGQGTVTVAGRQVDCVPSNFFWLIDEGEFIGSVSIRSRLDNPVLTRFGGHIGYGIRNSKRRLGYGRQQLKLALDICRGMGLCLVRISCAQSNIGSKRIIEANGGVLLRIGEPDWFVDHPYLLYEIPLI